MDQPYYLHWYTQGRRLPASWHEPPARPPLPHEIRWRLLAPFEGWCVDQWQRVWHLPGPDGLGRNRGWRRITKAVKNGYGGFRLRKNGREYWMSTRQLRAKLIRVYPT